jgi:hypothetical protein
MADLLIEPDEPQLEIEPEIEPDPSTTTSATTASDPVALMEILPADFQLPLLTKFIPNPALRGDADKAATYALSVKVDGAEGLQRADLALSALRASLKAITDHFEEPTAIAHALHSRLTSVRGEWRAQGEVAVKTVGNRIYTEQKRLADLAAEAQRKAQAEADRQAREAAQREAAAAEQAQAPAPVVEELKRQAETATAPPVQRTVASPLKSSTPVATWKARIVGTPGSDEANPTMEQLTTAQRHQVIELMKAVIEGKAPMAAFELSWSYLNKRAKSDKGTLAIAGIEAFEEGSVRAKGSRAKWPWRSSLCSTARSRPTVGYCSTRASATSVACISRASPANGSTSSCESTAPSDRSTRTPTCMPCRSRCWRSTGARTSNRRSCSSSGSASAGGTRRTVIAFRSSPARRRSRRTKART